MTTLIEKIGAVLEADPCFVALTREDYEKSIAHPSVGGVVDAKNAIAAAMKAAITQS